MSPISTATTVHTIETTADGRKRVVEAVRKRLRETRACAVIAVHGRLGHVTFDVLRNAARLGVVPFAQPYSIGVAEFDRTLRDLDGRIARGATE